MIISQVSFVLGAASIKQVPQNGIPQIAFLGRSNAGKSSLLNALFGNQIVKISNKPGKTRELNFFSVLANSETSMQPKTSASQAAATPHAMPTDEFYFVDLPGVGYAKVGIKERDAMAKRIKDYVESARDLRGIVYLLDVRHGGHQIDFDTINGIRSANRPILIVANKIDKLNQSEFQKARKAIKENFKLHDFPISVSARTKKGLPELWKEIDALLLDSELPLNQTAQLLPPQAEKGKYA